MRRHRRADLPFVGTLIYAIGAAAGVPEDAYEREVSIQANEALVKTLGELARSNRELSAQVARLEQLIVVRRKQAQGGGCAQRVRQRRAAAPLTPARASAHAAPP